ncbi:hypothetical protein BpHYR1_019771 [Brachionus plicatilis]|uniref:Uncharacterized protein n=1 Tax=Brachionus plicatilis TaxID=10195 RepID=A0A3M7PPS2_BRAPC|nr:hypothetical protein BpHYR1_019771 [Brachionus plicatilis]
MVYLMYIKFTFGRQFYYILLGAFYSITRNSFLISFGHIIYFQKARPHSFWFTTINKYSINHLEYKDTFWSENKKI